MKLQTINCRCGLQLGFALLFFAFSQATSAQSTIETSVYSDDFNNRKTASGEPYNPNKLTAAHKTFEFGKKLTLTNPENGKRVTVTVNDRGPYFKASALEISAAAAAKIGINRSEVHTLILGSDGIVSDAIAQKSAPSPQKLQGQLTEQAPEHGYLGIHMYTPDKGGYVLQLASVASFESVQKCLRQLQKRGLTNTVFHENNGRFKVGVGPYLSKEEAQKTKAKVKDLFPDAYVVQ